MLNFSFWMNYCEKKMSFDRHYFLINREKKWLFETLFKELFSRSEPKDFDFFLKKHSKQNNVTACESRKQKRRLPNFWVQFVNKSKVFFCFETILFLDANQIKIDSIHSMRFIWQIEMESWCHRNRLQRELILIYAANWMEVKIDLKKKCTMRILFTPLYCCSDPTKGKKWNKLYSKEKVNYGWIWYCMWMCKCRRGIVFAELYS